MPDFTKQTSSTDDILEVDEEDDENEVSVAYDIASYPSNLMLSVVNDMWTNKDIIIPDFQRKRMPAPASTTNVSAYSSAQSPPPRINASCFRGAGAGGGFGEHETRGWESICLFFANCVAFT